MNGPVCPVYIQSDVPDLCTPGWKMICIDTFNLMNFSPLLDHDVTHKMVDRSLKPQRSVGFSLMVQFLVPAIILGCRLFCLIRKIN